MCKKIISVVMSLLIVMSMFAGLEISSVAEDDILNYLTYEINDGEVMITDCDKSISGDVVIPDTIDGYPVTVIGENAFSFCYEIESLEIPDSITSIGDFCFSLCDGLSSVIIPDSVTSLGLAVFMGCFNLSSVEIGNGVTTINKAVFNECKKLTIVKIGSGVKSIEENAFASCTSLKKIEIPATVLSIADYSIGFEFHNRVSGEIYYTPIEGFEMYGISGSTAETYANKNDITFIPVGEDEPTTEEPTTEEPTTEPPAEQPDDTANYLTYKIIDGEVTITGYTSSIGSDVVIPDAIEGYPVVAIGEAAFDWSGIESITIPDSVKVINKGAFQRCKQLKKITIGTGLEIVDADAFIHIHNLETILVDEKNLNFSNDENGILFNKEKTEIIRYPSGRKNTEYEIPFGVTTIGVNAFYGCNVLTNIIIPDSVTTIKRNAFISVSLSELRIPQSVSMIEMPFICNDGPKPNNCKFIVDERNMDYSSDEKGVLFNKDKTELICHQVASDSEYVIPASVKIIGKCAFFQEWSLNSLIVPDSVTTISESAFNDCTNLKNITIPYSVITVGENAFINCFDLEYVKFINPDCNIYDHAWTFWEDTIIYGYPNSTAQIYAEKYNRTFIGIEGEPPTEKPTTEPTTKEPETEVPTTELTTKEPETEVPTTEPTTKEPETEVPTTEPTTKEPETEPTTKEPVTQAPTTEKPTEKPTEAPTQKPVSDKLEVSGDTVKVDNTAKVSTVKTKSSANDILKSVKNEKVSIVDKDGKAVSGDTLVGTGAKIQIKDNSGKVINTYTVCVPTDVDGNGKTTAADARLALRGSAKLEKVEGVYASASDMNSDGKITAADARKILRISAGLEKA